MASSRPRPPSPLAWPPRRWLQQRNGAGLAARREATAGIETPGPRPGASLPELPGLPTSLLPFPPPRVAAALGLPLCMAVPRPFTGTTPHAPAPPRLHGTAAAHPPSELESLPRDPEAAALRGLLLTCSDSERFGLFATRPAGEAAVSPASRSPDDRRLPRPDPLAAPSRERDCCGVSPPRRFADRAPPLSDRSGFGAQAPSIPLM